MTHTSPTCVVGAWWAAHCSQYMHVLYNVLIQLLGTCDRMCSLSMHATINMLNLQLLYSMQHACVLHISSKKPLHMLKRKTPTIVSVDDGTSEHTVPLTINRSYLGDVHAVGHALANHVHYASSTWAIHEPCASTSMQYMDHALGLP